MTAEEFREAVIAAYVGKTGLRPPMVRVVPGAQDGFLVSFTTTVFARDVETVVNEFRAAAGVQSGLLKTEGE